MQAARKYLVWFFVLVPFIPAGAQQRNLIREIRVEGCVYGSPEEVRAVAKTTTGADVSKDDVVLQIRDDIRAIYKLPFVKDVTVVGEPVADGVRLVFYIAENPRIEDVRFVGNKEIDRDDLLKAIEFIESSWIIGTKRTGAFFYTPHNANEIKKKILKKYTDKGLPEGPAENNTKVNSWDWQPTGENVGVLTLYIEEGKKLKIRETRFIGATAFDSGQIKKKIKSKKPWFPFFKKKFDQTVFDEDITRIEMLYKENGYLNVVVKKGEFGTTDGGKGLIVVFDITEGIQFRIGRITFSDNQSFSDEEIREVVKSVPGEICNWLTLSDDKQEIMNLHKGQGYLHVTVMPDIVQRAEESLADVQFVVREGPRIHLGNIYLRAVTTGDDGKVTQVPLKTKPFVVLREIRMESGEVLDWDTVRQAERRLLNLGYFEEDPDWSGDRRKLLYGFYTETADTENVEDLVLTVEEAQTGALSLGGGYNTVFGPSVFISLGENNLFGRGQTGRISFDIGSRRNAVNVNWTEPYLFGSDYMLSTNVFYRSYDAYGAREFAEERYGTSVKLGKRLSDILKASLIYRFEFVDISEIDQDNVIVIERPSFYEDRKLSTSSLTFMLERDTRDYREFPTKGTESSISFEVAGLGGDNEFFRTTTEGSWYHKLAEKLVFAVNAKVGLAFPFGGTDVLPLHERFFLGGANSVRGFDESGIGPHLPYIRAYPDPLGMLQVDENGEIILDRDYVNVGGESFSEAHFEIRYRLMKNLDLVTFVDAGTAGMEAEDVFSDYRLSTGAGLRVKLPFAAGTAIRLDYGVPILEKDHDEGQSFSFSFGHQF